MLNALFTLHAGSKLEACMADSQCMTQLASCLLILDTLLTLSHEPSSAHCTKPGVYMNINVRCITTFSTCAWIPFNAT